MGSPEPVHIYAYDRSSSSVGDERLAFVLPPLVVTPGTESGARENSYPPGPLPPSLRDHVDRAAEALGFRRTSREPEAPAPDRIHVTVTVRPDASPSAPDDAEPVASDTRGTVWRRKDGWTWVFPGYRLDTPETRLTARLTLFPDAEEADAPLPLGALLAYGLREAVVTLLPRIGWFPLHAAALTGPEASPGQGGVLLTGPSGCGKSTLTAGLLTRGFRCVSDDLLVIEPPRTEPLRVGRLTRGIRLQPDAAERLAVAGDASEGPGIAPEKCLVQPTEAQEAITCVPRVLLFPHIVDAPKSRLTPVPKREAVGVLLSQMSPPSLLTPHDNQAQLNRIAALLRMTSPFRLDAGQDLFARPGDLADLLRQQIPGSFVPS